MGQNTARSGRRCFPRAWHWAQGSTVMGKGKSCGFLPTEKLWLTPVLAKCVRLVK